MPDHLIVTIKLWRSDAVVLFDWLMEHDISQLPVPHKAIKQALTDLCTQIEAQTDIVGISQADVDVARRGPSKHGLGLGRVDPVKPPVGFCPALGAPKT